MNLIDRLLLFVFCPIVAVGYVFTNLTNDVKLFIGVEAIADKFYPFPQGIDLAWEIKPIGNRLVNWMWFKLLDALHIYGNYFLSDIAIKVVSLLVITIASYYFLKATNIPYSGYLTFFALTCISNFGVLQAEWWAVLFSIVSLALIIDNHPFPAGVLMAFVFLLKGITGLLVFAVFLGAFLLDENTITKWKQYAIGYASCAIFFVGMWLTYWPNMVPDMLLSPHLARVGLYSFTSVFVWFWAQIVVAPLHNSIMIFGIVFGAMFYFAWVGYQGIKFKSAYIALWLLPCFMVFAQGELFVYHYIVFIPTAIVTILLCERYSHEA